MSKERVCVAEDNYHGQTNCVGTALYISGCIEEDIDVNPPKFGERINNFLLDIPEPSLGCLVALFASKDDKLHHMGVVDGIDPITILDRAGPNGPIRQYQLLTDVVEEWINLSDAHCAYKVLFYNPKRFTLDEDLYHWYVKDAFHCRFPKAS